MTRRFRNVVVLALALLALLALTARGGFAAGGSAAEDVRAAHAAFARGDDVEAIQLFTRALARAELQGAQRGLAYVDRGLAYERQKNYAAMIADMERGVALRPHDRVAYMGLALGYQRNGEPQRAIVTYSQGLEAAGIGAFLLNGRGQAYLAAGDDVRARADFERAIALEPGFRFTYRSLGSLEFHQLHYDAALADFERLVTLDPAHGDGYELRGAVLFMLGRTDAAMADFDRALDLEPASEAAYRFRAYGRFGIQQFSAAAADFASAARLQPTRAQNELWGYVARLKDRSADPAALRAAAARFDRAVWPGPIFGLLLGEQSYADVRSLATAGVSPDVAKDRRCEAAFYAAELAVSREDWATARPIIVEALGTCFARDAEHAAAATELRRLAARPGR
jgi:tetratricopeptide (TPR) repeat protein